MTTITPGNGVPSYDAGARSLSGRTLVMSGGSRGIGLAIAKRAAADGANIVLLAKTAQPHPKLPGTIYDAADEIEAAGGHALPVVGDVRSDDDVARAVSAAVERFGGIDIVVNNASAIDLSTTDAIDMKRYDLMQDINARGTFLLSKLALPALRESAGAGRGAHILTLSPPLNLDPRWAGAHLAYTMAKYGMSLVTLGLAEELRPDGIGVNSLWPRTAIDTAAIRNVVGGDEMARSTRSPEIMADAAHAILTSDPRTTTGQFFVDEDALRRVGVTDFAHYSLGAPEDRLVPDFFL
ncbi:NAD(P)-dependent oxidoreductase [Sinomonas sp. JGH33]|uniref:NAD(P)-dependent oxidoreductase n=1 Tax=Sinomonas terricola TaxID=3110330 RepID=A0ABU5TAA4_9MICC|nr:NAD(P)-dependent oxidoreductase [Sinomonas sp. JGH33]MEA5456619.1 NAD(P)-dependent oxidoreductase [Sinomonas sp. JGH33]